MTERLRPCPPMTFDEPAALTDARRAVPVTPLHVDLCVEVDLAQRRVSGRVTHSVRVRARPTQRLRLDVGVPEHMRISSVLWDGDAVEFTHVGEVLEVEHIAPRAPGRDSTLQIAFDANPAAGLYFIAPDAEVPSQRAQAWTQGAMEDHHHWFPCFDAPEHMVTTRVDVTVPAPFVALSNGHPESTSESPQAGRHRAVWRMDTPHALYLLTLVVDDVVEVRDQAGDVSLHHWAPRGREADVRALFERVPQMVAYFAEATGRPYPFGRYGHVFLQEFMWGGMENSTLTSLTDQVLVQGHHRAEEDVERLIAHELAHQWFGDLIAPRGWPELWLNESFATYFELLCMQALEGDDDFARRLMTVRDSYFAEVETRYARPIVTRRYAHPYVLFDRHAYEKGCLVLHTLRDQLGEAAFWAGVQAYVAHAAGSAAETAALRRAFEDASGEDLTTFFEHWVYAPGHAAVRPTWRFVEGVGLEVTLERTDPHTQTLVVTVGVGRAQGGMTTHRVPLSAETRALVVPLDRAPRWVALDPASSCLVQMDERDEPDTALRARLSPDAPIALRARTARVLAARGTPQNHAALAHALTSDPASTVRVEAARALGEYRTSEARAVLLTAAATDADWRVRAASARAAALGAGADLVDALAARLQAEHSHRVRCGVLQGLGGIQDARARSLIEGQLEVESPRACIAATAITALAAQDAPDTLDAILSRTKRTAPRPVRVAAVAAVGRLTKLEATPAADRKRGRERLEALLADPTFAVRAAAIEALRAVSDAASLPALRRAHGAEHFGLLRRSLREALGALEHDERSTP